MIVKWWVWIFTCNHKQMWYSTATVKIFTCCTHAVLNFQNKEINWHRYIWSPENNSTYSSLMCLTTTCGTIKGLLITTSQLSTVIVSSYHHPHETYTEKCWLASHCFHRWIMYECMLMSPPNQHLSSWGLCSYTCTTVTTFPYLPYGINVQWYTVKKQISNMYMFEMCFFTVDEHT